MLVLFLVNFGLIFRDRIPSDLSKFGEINHPVGSGLFLMLLALSIWMELSSKIKNFICKFFVSKNLKFEK